MKASAMLNELQRKEFVDAIVEALEHRRSITDEIHGEHHAFVSLMMQKEKRRIERWEKFRMSLVGAGAVALVSLLAWIGMLIVEWIRHHSPT